MPDPNNRKGRESFSVSPLYLLQILLLITVGLISSSLGVAIPTARYNDPQAARTFRNDLRRNAVCNANTFSYVSTLNIPSSSFDALTPSVVASPNGDSFFGSWLSASSTSSTQEPYVGKWNKNAENTQALRQASSGGFSESTLQNIVTSNDPLGDDYYLNVLFGSPPPYTTVINTVPYDENLNQQPDGTGVIQPVVVSQSGGGQQFGATGAALGENLVTVYSQSTGTNTFIITARVLTPSAPGLAPTVPGTPKLINPSSQNFQINLNPSIAIPEGQDPSNARGMIVWQNAPNSTASHQIFMQPINIINSTISFPSGSTATVGSPSGDARYPQINAVNGGYMMGAVYNNVTLPNYIPIVQPIFPNASLNGPVIAFPNLPMSFTNGFSLTALEAFNSAFFTASSYGGAGSSVGGILFGYEISNGAAVNNLITID